MPTTSGLYRTDPAARRPARRPVLHREFQARATTTWLVNSEGAIVRKSAAEYQEAFGVGTQAPDGMRLDRSYATTGSVPRRSRLARSFQQHAVSLIASLADLRKAPLVEEEYHGPVLCSAPTPRADTLRDLLAGGVIATRPKLGTEARTNGPFASSFHARVLPDFLDVVDDPSLKTYAGKGLLGAYDIDDEGVPAQPVKLITAGKLRELPHRPRARARLPPIQRPRPRRHHRPAPPLHRRPQDLGQRGLSDDELNQKLLDLAKDRELKSVYIVATLGGRLTPRLLYRVSPDGKRELVRGAELDDLDQRALRSSITPPAKTSSSPTLRRNPADRPRSRPPALKT